MHYHSVVQKNKKRWTNLLRRSWECQGQRKGCSETSEIYRNHPDEPINFPHRSCPFRLQCHEILDMIEKAWCRVLRDDLEVCGIRYRFKKRYYNLTLLRQKIEKVQRCRKFRKNRKVWKPGKGRSELSQGKHTSSSHWKDAVVMGPITGRSWRQLFRKIPTSTWRWWTYVGSLSHFFFFILMKRWILRSIT